MAGGAFPLTSSRHDDGAATGPLAFHAAPPDGHWLNDPNALVRAGDGFRLLAQHRADAPAFSVTGWGSFASADLLGWRWTGEALQPDRGGWAYSGSAIRADDRLEILHTVHDPLSGLQHQRRLVQGKGDWQRCADDPELARPTANRRDPYVFAWGSEWRMLLTQSCDWHAWPADPPSRLIVLASPDRVGWQVIGEIGPWSPPGVLWEVPVLLRIGEADVLFVSLVDRRDGGATCSVRGWVGRFDGASFTPETGFPAAGQPVDLGPDFYALMPGVAADWPDERPCVAWAASWNTARAPIWPGFAGGPITLPRRIALRREEGVARLCSTPWPSLAAQFRPVACRPAAGRGLAVIDGAAPFELTVSGPKSQLHIAGDPGSGRLTMRRDAADAFAWSAEQEGALRPAPRRCLSLFIDGPLVEIFDESAGTTMTAALPGGVTAVQLRAGRTKRMFAWSTYFPGAGNSPGHNGHEQLVRGGSVG